MRGLGAMLMAGVLLGGELKGAKAAFGRAATCKSNCWDNKCVWSDGDLPSGDALCDGVGDGDGDGEFCKEDADFAINQVETPRAKLAEGDLVESPASMDMTIRICESKAQREESFDRYIYTFKVYADGELYLSEGLSCAVGNMDICLPGGVKYTFSVESRSSNNPNVEVDIKQCFKPVEICFIPFEGHAVTDPWKVYLGFLVLYSMVGTTYVRKTNNYKGDNDIEDQVANSSGFHALPPRYWTIHFLYLFQSIFAIVFGNVVYWASLCPKRIGTLLLQDHAEEIKNKICSNLQIRYYMWYVGWLFHCAGVGLSVHVYFSVYALYMKKKRLEEEEKERNSIIEEEEKTVIFGTDHPSFRHFLIACLSLFMTPTTALVNVILTSTPLGGVFQACFFAVPFWEFYEQRDLIKHIRVKGARIRLHLSFTDAYFFYLTEIMKNYMSWNLYEYMCWISFGGSKKKQNKWLDQHITWRGDVPNGLTNDFRILDKHFPFLDKVKLGILAIFFAWCPVICVFYHYPYYDARIRNLLLGGSRLKLGKNYTFNGYLSAYLSGSCGLFSADYKTYVDKNIKYSKWLKEINMSHQRSSFEAEICKNPVKGDKRFSKKESRVSSSKIRESKEGKGGKKGGKEKKEVRSCEDEASEERSDEL
ncbi:hypothetical protein TL16_g02708 [Triparma laevis f. inornata]|uniref:Uncharacterized protein n=1 Tax=Triparma laevis f. inornata TaxID=1714386 RepID=A0A9W6ZXM8_9STRA|nr:hypothetical protein TL16_g02708 [Triparma laevis f. inornata]